MNDCHLSWVLEEGKQKGLAISCPVGGGVGGFESLRRSKENVSMIRKPTCPKAGCAGDILHVQDVTEFSHFTIGDDHSVELGLTSDSVPHDDDAFHFVCERCGQTWNSVTELKESLLDRG